MISCNVEGDTHTSVIRGPIQHCIGLQNILFCSNYTTMVKNYIKILAKHLKQMSEPGLQVFIAELCKLKAPRGYSQIQKEDLKNKTLLEITETIIESYTTRNGPAKVIQALKNSKQNQIRLDLNKALKADRTKKNGKKKATNKAKAAPAGGQDGVAGQKPNAGESSKSSKRQQPGKDIKPKIEKSSVKAQTTGGAAGGKRKRKEQNGEDVKPKRTRKQPTSDKEHFVIKNRKDLIMSITSVDPVLDDLLDKKLLTQEQYDIVQKKGTNQEKMRELFTNTRGWDSPDYDKFLESLKKHNPVPINNLTEK